MKLVRCDTNIRMHTNYRRVVWLGVVIIVIGGLIWYLGGRQYAGPSGNFTRMYVSVSNEEKADTYKPAIEIVNPSGFINTDPISLKDLVGKKVILVDFWTYSCINCQRTTPYLNAWYARYRDQGLEIIGVHTPEFEFEKEYQNVVAAVEKFGIKYPVVLDNEYATWRAYQNQYWPRKYLIDIDGYIVYDHIGEGGYEETEKKIKELLGERAEKLGMQSSVESGTVSVENIESYAHSPEVYFGADRNEFLGNGRKFSVGGQVFTTSARVDLNTLYLVGDWDIQEEYAENVSVGARFVFRYKARDVYFVAGADKGVRVEVLRDGKPLGSEAGEDIIIKDRKSFLNVQEERLYKVVKDMRTEEHTLEFIIQDSRLRAFTFTFG